MINPKRRLFRWGPIPGRFLSVSHWVAIYYSYLRRLHKYVWPESFLVFYRSKMLFINEMKRLEKVGGRVFREIILARDVKRYWGIWRDHLFNLFSFCKKVDRDYLKSLSNSDLKKKWEEFNDLVYLFWEVGIIPELGAYGSEPILKDALDKEKLSEDKKRKFFSVLAAPTRLSFYQEEEIDFLKVLRNQKSKNFKKLLKKHQEKYFWLENSYFRTKVLKENSFLFRIKEKTKSRIELNKVIKEIYRHLKTTREENSKILARLENKKEIKKISDGLSYCIWWQDQRKKYIFQYLHYLDIFIREFSKRIKISPKIFDYAWPEEVSVCPSKRLLDLLKRRKRSYFVVHLTKNKKNCIYGKKAKKIYQTFWLEKKELIKDQFKGIVVYAGNKLIIGKVYIIRKVSDIKKFPLGKILVTTMTAPEYITAIKRAKAIVTDGGGITCHAAIVTRELKIPCIVGTKIATQTLRNGDLIEVDTNKGIVKILKGDNL